MYHRYQQSSNRCILSYFIVCLFVRHIFVCTSKSNQLAGILREKLASQKAKLNPLREKIIEIYTSDKVRTLNFSSDELWNNHISNLMTDVHMLRHFVINEIANDVNEVIRLLSSQYMNHYVNSDKLFRNM